jgi:hypothetical protein
MKDNLNDMFSFGNYKIFRLRRSENSIHRATPYGFNKIVWKKYGHDFCISSNGVKYLSYQQINLPKPTKP